MPTHKARVLAAARGEAVDRIPFVPRLDIWYHANRHAGTLPAAYGDAAMDEIARDLGWPLYKILPGDYDRRRESPHALHRALGLYPVREAPFDIRFDERIEIRTTIDALTTTVEYRTPAGVVRTVSEFTEAMLASGTTESWIREHAIKSPDDYPAVAYLFEHLEVIPEREAFGRWRAEVGEDGLAVAYGVPACSPMHLIQKVLIDPTEFFYHTHDHPTSMKILASCVAHYYDQVLEMCAAADAEAVLWGENVDSTLTPAPFFEKDILPWIRKAADRLHQAGKIVFCHTDGENAGLMDLIYASGIDVAESVCPFPMTRVAIDTLYRRWSDRLTIMGGIPSDLLIPRLTAGTDFEGYLDYLFKAVAPGTRIILGVADNVPPAADFQRLVRIAERAGNEGRLPLKKGPFVSPVAAEQPAGETDAEAAPETPGPMADVRAAVFAGVDAQVEAGIHAALDAGIGADEILQRGLIGAMEILGVRFKNDEVFMPEVLLSARAMNAGLAVLHPYLAASAPAAAARIVIGTVFGDMHDIGKNMVTLMLRGVGCEVVDLGINVSAAAFVEAVETRRPDVLALSALLSTTMPEMPVVIDALKTAGLRDRVAVIVGGAPVGADFAADIGADGHAATAGEVPELIRRLVRRP